jgi:hypothetical protein
LPLLQTQERLCEGRRSGKNQTGATDRLSSLVGKSRGIASRLQSSDTAVGNGRRELPEEGCIFRGSCRS